MKRLTPFLSAILLTCSLSTGHAQSTELQQLILNVEKLSQLKAILENMQKGYETLTSGYRTVKDMTEGNFNIHKVFLDGLLKVSPTVANYKKVVEIITRQKQIITTYTSGMSHFKATAILNEDDLQLIENTCKAIINDSVENLEELLMVITSGQLRMNDAERIEQIDRIHGEVSDQLNYIVYFNKKALVLEMQKQKALKDIEAIKQMQPGTH